MGKGFHFVPEKLGTFSMIVICQEFQKEGDEDWLQKKFKPLVPAELSQYGFNSKEFTVESAIISGRDYKNLREDLRISLTRAWKALKSPALVIVQLPKRDKDLYSHVKWWGDCFVGVPTVCITYQKLGNPNTFNEQLVGNLA